MSPSIARRPLLASVLGIAGLALIGGGIYENAKDAAHHYPHTPYDDLLYKLSDRESAKALGAQVLAKNSVFDPRRMAKFLRLRLKRKSLVDVLEADIRNGATIDLRGWIIPRTLADLCALAAKVG